MKLIEVVVLMGAHCISPIQSTEAVTEAAKVQCAAVVEKDAERGTVRVVPAGAATHPQVVAVIDRFTAGLPPGTRIEPAFAPPSGSTAPSRKPLAGVAAVPQVAIAEPPAAPVQAAPEKASETAPAAGTPLAPRKKAAAVTLRPGTAAEKGPARKKMVKTAAKSTKGASQCAGAAVPKWYTTDGGNKRYRCVKRGASVSTPLTLYDLR